MNSNPPPAPGSPGRIVSVIGAKGGVGTTTVALNAAAALTRSGRVVAAELGPWVGSFGTYLRQAPVLGPCPAATGREEVDARLVALPCGLRVLFGPRRPEEVRDPDPGRAGALLDDLAALADYVVVDLSPGLTAVNEAAVRRSDRVVLVVARDPACVWHGRALLDALRRMAVPPTAVGAVVVNHTAYGVPMNVAEVRAQLGCEILGVVPPAAEHCLLAARSGAPLVFSQPHSMAAAAFEEIAGRLGARVAA